MAGGRPRTVSLPAPEMKMLGKEMVDWVIKNNPYHLSEWYTVVKMFTYNQWKAMHVAPEFLPYYEKALKIVAKKYIDGTVNATIASRWLRVYFNDLREREDADFDKKLEKELQKKFKEIEFEAKQKQINETPPLADTVDLQNENMILKAKIRALESKIADQP